VRRLKRWPQTGQTGVFGRLSSGPLLPEVGVPDRTFTAEFAPHMAARLIRGLDALLQARRQTHLAVGHWSGKRLVTAVGLRNRFYAAVVHAFLDTSSSPNLPPHSCICARALRAPQNALAKSVATEHNDPATIKHAAISSITVKRILFRFTAVMVGIGATALIAELALQLVAPVRLPSSGWERGYFCRYDPDLGWAPPGKRHSQASEKKPHGRGQPKSVWVARSG